MLFEPVSMKHQGAVPTWGPIQYENAIFVGYDIPCEYIDWREISMKFLIW